MRDQAVPGHPRGGNQGRERPGLPLLPIPPQMSPFAKPNRYHRARRPREGVHTGPGAERGDGVPLDGHSRGQPRAQGPAWAPDPPASCRGVKPTLLPSQRSSCWEKGARSAEGEPQTPSVRERVGVPRLLVPPPRPAPEDGLRAPRGTATENSAGVTHITAKPDPQARYV